MAPRIPIKVDGSVLSPQAIAEEAQNHPAKTPAAAFQLAARALVIKALLLEEAKRLDVSATPELLAPGKRETPDEARIRSLIEQSVVIVEADEPACRDYYERHAKRFRSPDLFEASHILFAAHPHDTAAFASAETEAKAAIEELARTPSSFETIARERSDCQSKVNGGRLGQLGGGELVAEIETVLRGLDEGEITPSPVKSRFGVHIVRLDRRKLGSPLPFSYVHEQIALLIGEREWRRNVATYIEGLIAKAHIEGVDMSPASPRGASAA